jgi:hypothetical protein
VVQWGNGIGDEGCKALGEALKVNSSMRELNLVRALFCLLFLYVGRGCLRLLCCCGE